jgi:hypothetical protein
MPIRSCCCSDTCTNPTGTRTITSTFRATAVCTGCSIPGINSSFDYQQDITLNCSGTNVLSTSTARIMLASTNLITGISSHDRKIDMTLSVSGNLDCTQGGSHTCGDCGSGELPGAVYTYGPELSTPYKIGATQFGSITVNSYTNTATGPNPAPTALGFFLQNRSYGSSPSPFTQPFYLYDGSTVTQPSSNTGGYWEPLRVWRSSKTGGQPTDVCLPEWTVWAASNTPSSGGLSSGIRPLCPSDKTALESAGWVFSTYTRTATMV